MSVYGSLMMSKIIIVILYSYVILVRLIFDEKDIIKNKVFNY